MALFFDQTWFDAQLEARQLSHEALAEALTLPLSELVAIWKDQREVSAKEVAVLAQVLNVSPTEVASRAGISTPTPGTEGADPADQETIHRLNQTLMKKIERLEARVQSLEADIKDLKSRR